MWLSLLAFAFVYCYLCGSFSYHHGIVQRVVKKWYYYRIACTQISDVYWCTWRSDALWMILTWYQKSYWCLIYKYNQGISIHKSCSERDQTTISRISVDQNLNLWYESAKLHTLSDYIPVCTENDACNLGNAKSALKILFTCSTVALTHDPLGGLGPLIGKWDISIAELKEQQSCWSR